MALKRQRLARRREAVGLTQERLAEALGVERSTVVRWEGARGAPRPWMRPKLARLLRVDAEQLEELLNSVTDTKQPPHALGSTSNDPARVDLTVTAALRTDLDHLTARYDRAPSASLLADAGQHLNQLAHLANGAKAGRVQRELRTLQADASTLMGQLVWDASQRRDHATARTYYEQSVSIARHLRDPVIEGHALLRLSHVALYGARDPSVGLALCRQAAEVAETASNALAGLSLLHAGEAHAMLGQATDCERTLANAQEHLGRAEPTDAAADLLSPTQFGRLAGSCYLSLGWYHRAQDCLHTTAAQLRDRRKSRAIVLGNLALSYVRQQEVDAAAATLHEAIAELEETRGGGGMNLVFAAARELRPWKDQPAVADVHDRLLALMASP
ncbi:helix-turn-helix transcriptional regulator [Streptomyces sp. NPDC018019]|uniref:helix-turn-helix transcriptional regulator n=1 Tax=Streptomyces sp. NPDC018019 TaxID=3365030 RepID=UPI0037B11FD5